MRFELGKTCVVDVEDGYNYTLRQRRVSEKSGEVVEKTDGYHTSLESAVDAAVLHELCAEADASEARAVVVGIKRTVDAAREVTRDLRANVDDLKSVPELLSRPTATNLEKAMRMVKSALS